MIYKNFGNYVFILDFNLLILILICSRFSFFQEN